MMQALVICLIIAVASAVNPLNEPQNCIKNDKIYGLGQQFESGCKTCHCIFKGKVICVPNLPCILAKKALPSEKRNCTNNGKAYILGEFFIDGCKRCYCLFNSLIGCYTPLTCLINEYYNHGRYIRTYHKEKQCNLLRDCIFCNCSIEGKVICPEISTTFSMDERQEIFTKNEFSGRCDCKRQCHCNFQRQLNCSEIPVGTTETLPSSKNETCIDNGKTYNVGDNFVKGCKICYCRFGNKIVCVNNPSCSSFNQSNSSNNITFMHNGRICNFMQDCKHCTCFLGKLNCEMYAIDPEQPILLSKTENIYDLPNNSYCACKTKCHCDSNDQITCSDMQSTTVSGPKTTEKFSPVYEDEICDSYHNCSHCRCISSTKIYCEIETYHDPLGYEEDAFMRNDSKCDCSNQCRCVNYQVACSEKSIEMPKISKCKFMYECDFCTCIDNLLICDMYQIDHQYAIYEHLNKHKCDCSGQCHCENNKINCSAELLDIPKPTVNNEPIYANGICNYYRDCGHCTCDYMDQIHCDFRSSYYVMNYEENSFMCDCESRCRCVNFRVNCSDTSTEMSAIPRIHRSHSVSACDLNVDCRGCYCDTNKNVQCTVVQPNTNVNCNCNACYCNVNGEFICSLDLHAQISSPDIDKRICQPLRDCRHCSCSSGGLICKRFPTNYFGRQYRKLPYNCDCRRQCRCLNYQVDCSKITDSLPINTCNYNGETYNSMQEFRIGCKKCSCLFNGRINCTKIIPCSITDLLHNTTGPMFYDNGRKCVFKHDCKHCHCWYNQLMCDSQSPIFSHKNLLSSQNRRILLYPTFKRCNCTLCHCNSNGQVNCTKLVINTQEDAGIYVKKALSPPKQNCTQNGKIYKYGEKFRDRCKKCRCLANGYIKCLHIYPCNPLKQCYHMGKVYEAGQWFTDSCNRCICHGNGHAACTKMSCGPLKLDKEEVNRRRERRETKNNTKQLPHKGVGLCLWKVCPISP